MLHKTNDQFKTESYAAGRPDGNHGPPLVSTDAHDEVKAKRRERAG